MKAQRFFLPLLLMLASGCASLGTTSASLDTQLYRATLDTDVVVQGTDAALNSHLISSSQAQSVSTITKQVAPLIKSAKAANDAGDTTNANSTAAFITQLLAGLAKYVAVTQQPVGGAP